jgi:hypothetical protein
VKQTMLLIEERHNLGPTQTLDLSAIKPKGVDNWKERQLRKPKTKLALQ